MLVAHDIFITNFTPSSILFPSTIIGYALLKFPVTHGKTFLKVKLQICYVYLASKKTFPTAQYSQQHFHVKLFGYLFLASGKIYCLTAYCKVCCLSSCGITLFWVNGHSPIVLLDCRTWRNTLFELSQGLF